MPILRYRLEASVNEQEYKRIEAYCNKHKISIYKLVKDAVFEVMENDK